jgi:hypothetical protein
MQNRSASKHFVVGSVESLRRPVKSVPWRHVTLRRSVSSKHLIVQGVGDMDMPDELNKLMAELKQATRMGSETGRLDRRPSANDIDQFLSQYGFDEDVVVERIEITEQGVFQFYLFATWRPGSEELSLFQMTDRG